MRQAHGYAGRLCHRCRKCSCGAYPGAYLGDRHVRRQRGARVEGRGPSHAPAALEEYPGSLLEKPAVCTEETASGLRDHEHDGHDGKCDAADCEYPDGPEPQRYVATGSQRTLQLALALCADDQQPDRE